MSKICKVEGCEKKHYCKGYCSKHYQQFKKYGCIPERTPRDPNEIVEYDDYAEMVLYNQRSEEVGRAIIDLECVDLVKDYKWYLDSENYVINSEVGKLHRFLMNAPKGMVIDHKNRNPLDNRLDNLRHCTVQQNSMNRSIQCNNTSGVTGVYWSKTYNKWIATIKINGKRKHLGYFKEKEDAIEARRQAEIVYFGEYNPNTED